MNMTSRTFPTIPITSGVSAVNTWSLKCSRCRSLMSKDYKFCTLCGNPLRPSEIIPKKAPSCAVIADVLHKAKPLYTKFEKESKHSVVDSHEVPKPEFEYLDPLIVQKLNSVVRNASENDFIEKDVSISSQLRFVQSVNSNQIGYLSHSLKFEKLKKLRTTEDERFPSVSLSKRNVDYLSDCPSVFHLYDDQEKNSRLFSSSSYELRDYKDDLVKELEIHSEQKAWLFTSFNAEIEEGYSTSIPSEVSEELGVAVFWGNSINWEGDDKNMKEHVPSFSAITDLKSSAIEDSRNTLDDVNWLTFDEELLVSLHSHKYTVHLLIGKTLMDLYHEMKSLQPLLEIDFRKDPSFFSPEISSSLLAAIERSTRSLEFYNIRFEEELNKVLSEYQTELQQSRSSLASHLSLAFQFLSKLEKSSRQSYQYEKQRIEASLLGDGISTTKQRNQLLIQKMLNDDDTLEQIVNKANHDMEVVGTKIKLLIELESDLTNRMREEQFIINETINHWMPLLSEIASKLTRSVRRAEKWLLPSASTSSTRFLPSL
jgi:hypothetical protein